MILAGWPAAGQERWQTTPPADPYRQANPYQTPPPPPPDPAADLRRNLATVGTNPNNVVALVESGRAALAMGDAQAALTFFSRADEISPRDARIKAGMASAMTMLGQPRPALTLFAEAQGLGAPEIEIASDRGLAHDLLGDPRAAQRDYALVLRQRDNDETRRRLALSLAISGQRGPALRLLEPQTRRNDRAGWRTQAFVLALTGDTDGATRVAAGAGPIGTAEAMAPFLSRLPALSPAQRAMAVHLGVFPSDGRAQYAANVDTTPYSGALALAGGPDRPPAPPATEQPARRDERPGLRRRSAAASPIERGAVRAPQPQEERPLTFAERREGTYRIPGPNFPARSVRRVPAPPSATPAPGAAAPSAPDPYRFADPPSGVQSTPPVQRPSVQPSVSEPVAPPVQERPPTPPAIDSAILAGVRPGDMIAAPGFSLTAPPGPPPPPPGSERRIAALGDVAMVVNALPQDQGTASLAPAPRPPGPPAQRGVAVPASPGRHWVQLAGGIETASMAGELRRLRGRAPALLNEMQGWTARVGGTRLLLVGPFGTARDAQAFVNQLRPRGIEAVAWASAAEQAVERLSVPAGSAQASRPAPQRRAGARSEMRQAAGSSTRSARGRNEDSRAATASRGGRNRNEDGRATPGRPAARGRAEDSRASASARNARGRAEETRAGAGTRNARDRAEPAGTRGNARNSRTTTADTRSNRRASTVERRANDRDARPSRSRSGEEQRSSSRRGRAG